ncbi:MAG TPA: hypothetical protein VNO22_03590 [Planctomycetota bacterium]|nr:hypothetical protein [Planctomycetota bacterium]
MINDAASRPDAAGLRIPDALRHDVEQIFKLTDPFCAEHLDAGPAPQN